jgi:hypothetical protein
VRRTVARILEFGGLGVVVFLAGLVVGGGIVYGLHTQHWLGNPQQHTKAAFSEVPEPEAGQLAERFRPWLKFDTLEKWRPLSISHLFEERIGGQPAHEFCSRPPAETGCTPIQDESQFARLAGQAGALGTSTYIDLAGTKLDDYHGPVQCGDLADCGTGPPSAIYYHVMQSNDRFYIDYWWFLRFNNFYRSDPSLSCRSAIARVNGICDEHEGDWEGVTAVTSPGDDTQLDYVVYAAHKGTFRYAASEIDLHDGTRPDVYVARGSHASYPQACPRSCDQPIALSAQGLVTLPESSFDGTQSWARNGETCIANAPGSCLLSLPRTDQNPQAWAVWQGQWGAGCLAACDDQPGIGSPRSPGLQTRYQTPWCSTQGAVLTCDSVALGCSDWLGPLVVGVACDPAALAEGLAAPEATHPGNLALTVRRKTKTSETTSAETTPGVVQALGDPLAPGDTMKVFGDGSGLQILVRAQQGRHLVEARFDKLDLGGGREAVVKVEKGTGGPTVLLDGKKPVERRIITVQPAPAAGR